MLLSIECCPGLSRGFSFLRQAARHSKYDELARINGFKFVAFALESTGAFGEEAMEFINSISALTDDPSLFYVYCMRRLSIALQRGNALVHAEGIMNSYRKEESAARAHVGEVPLPRHRIIAF